MEPIATDWSAVLDRLFSPESIVPLIKAAATLILGFALARLAGSVLDRLASRHMSPQHRMILRRGVVYGLMGLVVATALSEIGLDLTVLLGAAGVLSVAVGFASQTSASNLISGLFLLAEQPFVLGDVISVEGTIGEVVAIDLLSVKLRTFDNLLVRLPNEVLLKSPITNLTAYPIRRCDIRFRIGVGEDVGRVRQLLMDVAERIPICLDEPRPQLMIEGFSELGTELQFSAWSARDTHGELRWALQQQVRAALVEAGIDIPTHMRLVQPTTDAIVAR